MFRLSLALLVEDTRNHSVAFSPGHYVKFNLRISLGCRITRQTAAAAFAAAAVAVVLQVRRLADGNEDCGFISSLDLVGSSTMLKRLFNLVADGRGRPQGQPKFPYVRLLRDASEWTSD